MTLLLETHSKLLMIGDSITDAGRARPVGTGSSDALGNGYVSLVDSLLGSTYPKRQIQVVNMGTSGNTVRDLKGRWQTDVFDLAPDWVSIMIGTNDVWRQFDSPAQPERHVYPDEYEATLTELVVATRPRVKGLVLMTPFYIEPDLSDPMRAQMDKYGRIVEQIALEYDAFFADTQAAFDLLLKDLDPMTLAFDRVHPTQTGSMVLARTFLTAIGYQWHHGLV